MTTIRSAPEIMRKATTQETAAAFLDPRQLKLPLDKEDANDRLIEEQRGLDMMESEMARAARRPNGQDTAQSQ